MYADASQLDERTTGFCTMSNSIPRKVEVTGYENHPNDSRVTESGFVSQTLSSRMGTGGGNCPIVLVRKVCNDGREGNSCGYGRRKELVADNDGCYSNPLHDSRRGTGDTVKTQHKWRIRKPWCGDGDKLKPRSDYHGRKGGNGFGLSEDGSCYTQTVVDRHMVFYVKSKSS